MTNKMLIDATHPEETRVVVKRGNTVEEFDFESAERAQIRGNIYLARVTRVEPSLQAAFVDYGGNRHGFLAFNEIHPDYYQIPVADREALLAEEATQAKEAAAEEDKKDAEAEARSSAENGEDEVEEAGAADVAEEVPQQRQRPPRRNYKIQEVIKRRQIILVQVVKEERGTKGAALTTYLSIAGRYAVLMPNTARGGGISRKITNVTDRKRLKEMAQELEVPQGMGLILRTAGANRTKTEIKRDFEHLLRVWENVRELTLQSNAPTLVYEEGSLVKRAIRDLYTRDIDEVMVAGDEAYKEAKAFMRLLMPSHGKNVKAYKDQLPIFTAYRVEDQLDAMFSPQVGLKNGAYIVINQTEALVAIDVNSGRATKEHNIEDTAYKTNIEAAKEVARQLKLRDLAGLIVVDFIDMEDKKHIREVERVLKDALKNDRARIQVGRISTFGLLEMSRQRLRSGVVEGSTEICPHCHGTGIVRSVSSVTLHVLRAIEEEFVGAVAHDLTVRTSTAVALYILNNKHRYLMELEDKYGVRITIDADDNLGKALLTIEKGAASTKKVEPTPITMEEPEEEDIPEEIDEEEDAEPVRAREPREPREPRETRDEDDDQPRRKRRRRRRGRGRSEGGRDEDAREGGVAEAGAEDADETDADEGEEGAGTEGSENGEGGERKRRRRGRRGGARRRRRIEEAEAGEGETSAGAAARDAEAEAAVATSEGSTLAEASQAPAEVTLSEAQADVESHTGDGSAAPVAEEKPKRKRAPRKKVAEAAPQESVAELAQASEAPAEEKPKRKRAPRKKPETAQAAAPVEAATPTGADPVTASDVTGTGIAGSGIAQEPAPAETPAPAPERAPEAASEPAPAATPEPAEAPERRDADEDEDKSARKGWWQRRVFGK